MGDVRQRQVRHFQRPRGGRQSAAEEREREDLFLDAVDDLLLSGRRSRTRGLNIEHRGSAEVRVTDVEIVTEEAGRRIGKPPGHYVTMEAPKLRHRNRTVEQKVSTVIAEELQRLTGLKEDSVVLVVGLGNERATPDALGPRVVADLLITRHLQPFVPEDMRGQLRAVCGVAPGVLGTTGIETGEIIRGIVERVKPDVVVAIDALASRSIDRMLTTIQLADTGIRPASGVGGQRLGITEDVLGIPVIAMGVPTVVHALTIATETISAVVDELQSQGKYDHLQGLTGDEKTRLVNEVLGPLFGNLMVTAKEIDVFIEDLSRTIASGMNAAFHPGVEVDQDLAFLF